MNKQQANVTKQRDLSGLSVPELHSIILEQDRIIETFTQRLLDLEEQVRLLKHHRFSATSEKQDLLHPPIFDEGDTTEADDDPTEQEQQSTSTQANRKSKNIDTRCLPRTSRIIDFPEEEKRCSCGALLEKIGEEVKEEIKLQPRYLNAIEHIRIKYVCRACETVKTPAAIELPILKSKASAELLTEIILNKYEFHLPLYRQSHMLSQDGIEVPDNTLGGWVMKTAEQLEPLYIALWNQIPLVRALQADETPVKILDPEKQAYMWLYHSYLPGQQFVIFDFNLSRSSDIVNERLKNFKGILQTDGYSGYNQQRAREDIISMGCWDHARRKFTEVAKANGKNKSGKAGAILGKIGKLYEIEREIKDLNFDERKKVRGEKANPLLKHLYEYLCKINAPPKSLLGIAITYCKNKWEELIRYIDYGEAQISNCWIENQVRPFAVGKKNWLFVGNEQSAQRSALLYSLIQSCKLNKINPRAYFEYVLNKVHPLRRREIDPTALLPHLIDKTLLAK